MVGLGEPRLAFGWAGRTDLECMQIHVWWWWCACMHVHVWWWLCVCVCVKLVHELIRLYMCVCVRLVVCVCVRLYSHFYSHNIFIRQIVSVISVMISDVRFS